ncbi:MAG: hypothetical protein KGQ38_03170 [Actinomycetales bacterium]|nr:hypothetical protein [Actinomycetales bacterium]
MSDEKPTDPTKAKSARKPKIVKPRPNSTVVPARTKADKAKRERAKNFVQIELPKSLATMTDEEIMLWAAGLYKTVTRQLKTNS